MSHEDLQTMEIPAADFVFTDSLRHVPFGGRRGNIVFLENISSFIVPADLDGVMEAKVH